MTLFNRRLQPHLFTNLNINSAFFHIAFESMRPDYFKFEDELLSTINCKVWAIFNFFLKKERTSTKFMHRFGHEYCLISNCFWIDNQMIPGTFDVEHVHELTSISCSEASSISKFCGARFFFFIFVWCFCKPLSCKNTSPLYLTVEKHM